MLGAPLSALAQDKDSTYALTYRGHNVWVHADDMTPLNRLSTLAKDSKVHSFAFYLPEDVKKDALFLERLTVVRDILMKRLGTDDIKLTQEGTHPKDNTIIISPR